MVFCDYDIDIFNYKKWLNFKICLYSHNKNKFELQTIWVNYLVKFKLKKSEILNIVKTNYQ